MPAKAELFPWKDEYKSGIAPIDEQNVAFVGLINSLYECMTARETNDRTMHDLFSDIAKYAKRHFRLEEKIFREAGIQASEHVSEHRNFESKIAELHERFITGDFTYKFEIARFMKSWLTEHIKDKDIPLMRRVINDGYMKIANSHKNRLRTITQPHTNPDNATPWWKRLL